VLTKPPAHFRNRVDGLEFARIYPDEPGLGFRQKDFRRMRVFFVGLAGNGKEVSYNVGDRRLKAIAILNSLFRKTNEGEFGRIAREAFQTDDPKLEELVKERGISKGENNILALIKRLLLDGRSNNIERVSSDTAYCKKLLVEYGIA